MFALASQLNASAALAADEARSASAATPATGAERSQDEAGGEAPGLDTLLRLPDSYQDVEGARKGGITQNEWQRRFRDNKAALDAARADLEKAKKQLEGVAADGANWNIAPPGAKVDPNSTPLSFKLMQEIRNGREQVATLERARRQLEIQADLAGVPDDWRN